MTPPVERDALIQGLERELREVDAARVQYRRERDEALARLAVHRKRAETQCTVCGLAEVNPIHGGSMLAAATSDVHRFQPPVTGTDKPVSDDANERIANLEADLNVVQRKRQEAVDARDTAIRERDEARAEMQAGKTINAGHLLRLNTAREVIAQRDRRIAELEAALRMWSSGEAMSRADVWTVTNAALRGAPAQPAMECPRGCKHGMYDGGGLVCALCQKERDTVPAQPATATKCMWGTGRPETRCDRQKTDGEYCEEHGGMFAAPPSPAARERMERHNEEEAIFNAESPAAREATTFHLGTESAACGAVVDTCWLRMFKENVDCPACLDRVNSSTHEAVDTADAIRHIETAAEFFGRGHLGPARGDKDCEFCMLSAALDAARK